VQKLQGALEETCKFVTNDQKLISQSIDESSQLGHYLGTFATEPFRDAHMKNRMISIDKKLLSNNYTEFSKWVDAITLENLFDWLRRSTYDIDFETGFWLVNQWDDQLHIISSNNLGLEHSMKSGAVLDLLDAWGKHPTMSQDHKVIWATLLCRSLREYCRRLWYDHVMPGTYLSRYRYEQRDYFLELAITASNNLDGYTAIKDFLETCRSSGDAIWHSSVAHEVPDSVVAQMPWAIILKKISPSVFVSYSNQDFEIAKRLVSDLEIKGVRIWIDQRSLQIGDSIVKAIDDAITESEAIIVLISRNSLNSRWCQEEWWASLYRAIEGGKMLFIPILLDDCSPGPLIGHRKYIDLRHADQYELALTAVLTSLSRLH
jgi:hypothetical protein